MTLGARFLDLFPYPWLKRNQYVMGAEQCGESIANISIGEGKTWPSGVEENHSLGVRLLRGYESTERV